MPCVLVCATPRRVTCQALTDRPPVDSNDSNGTSQSLPRTHAWPPTTLRPDQPHRQSSTPGKQTVEGSRRVLGRWQQAGISHRFLTDWTDGTGLWRPFLTPSRTLTCDSGLRSTGRTGSIDLRITRLG